MNSYFRYMVYNDPKWSGLSANVDDALAKALAGLDKDQPLVFMCLTLRTLVGISIEEQGKEIPVIGYVNSHEVVGMSEDFLPDQRIPFVGTQGEVSLVSLRAERRIIEGICLGAGNIRKDRKKKQ